MKLLKFLSQFFNSTKDIIFPMYCLKCGVEGSFVCNTCFQTLDCSGVFYCPVCRNISNGGEVCQTCKPQSHIDSHMAVTVYNEKNLIGDILHTFKYSYAEDVSGVLRRMIQQFCRVNLLKADIIVSVPLHRKRFVERGFNQAEKIAIILSDITKIPQYSILKRARHTRQQAKLNRTERLKNLDDAFVVIDDHQILKGKKVLLVDDVLTTGSTMQECARVLKQSGVQIVQGFTIARG